MRAALFALLLAGCSAASAFEREQRKYDFLKANGASNAELCEQAQIVENAAASDNRSEDYSLARNTRQADCLAARLNL